MQFLSVDVIPTAICEEMQQQEVADKYCHFEAFWDQILSAVDPVVVGGRDSQSLSQGSHNTNFISSSCYFRTVNMYLHDSRKWHKQVLQGWVEMQKTYGNLSTGYALSLSLVAGKYCLEFQTHHNSQSIIPGCS